MIYKKVRLIEDQISALAIGCCHYPEQVAHLYSGASLIVDM